MKTRDQSTRPLEAPTLGKRWSYPAAVPAYEHLALERTVEKSDVARPLASTALPGKSRESHRGLPRAHRVTSDDPIRAFEDRRPVDALVVNLLDPECDPALQLTWGLANLEKVGLAVDALRAAHAVGRVIIAAYVNAPPGWLDLLREFAAARRVPTMLAEVPPRYPVAFVQLLRRQLRLRQRQRVVTLDAVALVEIGHLQLEHVRPSLVPVAIRAGEATHYHTVARGSRLSRVLSALQIDAAGRAIVAGPLLRGVSVEADVKRTSGLGTAAAQGKMLSSSHQWHTVAACGRTADPSDIASAPHDARGVADLRESTDLDSGDLSFHVVPASGLRDPVGCIRCGWCAEVCPAALAPIELFDAALRRDRDALERGHVRACVDCGLCTAICPSQIALHDAFAPRGSQGPSDAQSLRDAVAPRSNSERSGE